MSNTSETTMTPIDEAVDEIAGETSGTTAVTTQEAAPVEKSTQRLTGADDFDGDFAESDIQIPRLGVCQPDSKLDEEGFEPGELVFNASVALPTPVDITVLRVKKTIWESLPFDSEQRPQVFDSYREAQAAGLRTKFGPNGEKPETQDVADLTLLVRKPEGVDAPEFMLEHDGVEYALCVWRNASYNLYQAVAGKILTARMLYMNSFYAKRWTVQDVVTKKIQLSDKLSKKTYVPQVKLGEATTPEFRQWADSLIG